MIIGHLPAGYILAKTLIRKLAKSGIHPHYIMLAGVIGAIFPDFDMFYFYLIDNRQHHHHTYWSHYPIIWLTLTLLSVVWYRSSLEKFHATLAIIFSSAGLIHLFLDTIVGDV